MLSLPGIISFLNDRNRALEPYIVKWREVYYGMSLHIDGACPAYQYQRTSSELPYWVFPKGYFGWQYQLIFDTKLLNRHPRENEVTRQWRLSQYKPFTQAPFQKIIQVVTGAIFQDSGYSIEVDNKDDMDYVWGNNFNGYNLPTYFADKFQWICEDPNGWFVTIPKEPGYATSTSKIEPSIYFIPSKDILYVTDDEIIFNAMDFTWVVNNIGYFRFVKENGGETSYIMYPPDEKFGGYYAHSFGKKPAMIAGGLWNTQGFYDSWLNAAKAIADEYVSSKSAEQLVNKEASHPFIIEASEDCPKCNAIGWVQWCKTCNSDQDSCSCENAGSVSLEKRNCPACGGGGVISRSPGDRMIAPKEDMDKDLVKIVNPQVDINKFHAENNKDLYNCMMQALHLDYIEEAQSGVAKDKDMETRYQFVLSISNDLFDRLISGALEHILGLRNITASYGTVMPSKGTYKIIKPTQFQIYTSYDLMMEYGEANKSGLPAYQVQAVLEDYVDKRFGGNDVLKRKTCLINQMDILAGRSAADIQIILLNNGATPRDLQFSIQLPKILDTIVREQGAEWFIKQPYEAIEAQANEMFNDMKPVLPVIVPPDETIEETRVNV